MTVRRNNRLHCMKFKFHANFLFHLFIGFCLLEIRNVVENSVWCNANNDIPLKQINRDKIKYDTHNLRTNNRIKSILTEWQNNNKKRSDPAQKQHSDFQSERMWLFFFLFSFVEISLEKQFYVIRIDIVSVRGMDMLYFVCVFFIISYVWEPRTWCIHNNSIRFNGENLIFEHQSQVKILTIASKESENLYASYESWKEFTKKNKTKWNELQRNAEMHSDCEIVFNYCTQRVRAYSYICRVDSSTNRISFVPVVDSFTFYILFCLINSFL